MNVIDNCWGGKVPNLETFPREAGDNLVRNLDDEERACHETVEQWEPGGGGCGGWQSRACLGEPSRGLVSGRQKRAWLVEGRRPSTAGAW